jgi:single-stranded-DNA-specific exonuclease
VTVPLNKYRWEQANAPDAEVVRRLAKAVKSPAAGARFLASRSLVTPEAAIAYLDVERQAPPSPFRFQHMERAVSCVQEVIARKKRILVHGDYDVDGVSGTALLYEYLHGLVPHVFRFLPDRRKDGYGIAARAVEWAIENHIGLVIAVDCGTSDGDVIRRMEEAGITTVVCDHHELPASGGVHGILLNPVREDETYPFRGLCGTGVAYKLIQALHERGIVGSVTPESLLDLVALATVGDLAPLVDENRLLVRLGLRRMNENRRTGLSALISAARLDAPEITATHIGYMLAPRLNAPGRLSNPKPALEILCEKEPAASARLASQLERENERRKELTEQVRNAVVGTIQAMSDWRERGGFVLAGRDWDEGVLGIAAARVVDDFGKPAVLISTAGEIGKGSGRSVPGIHLKAQLDRCSAHLTRFGGHAQAVGFSIEPSEIEAFTRDLTAQFKVAAEVLPSQPRLGIDADLRLDECTLDLVDFLAACEPFGFGNRAPVWRIPGVTVLEQSRFVGNGHLKWFVTDGNGTMVEAISFNWSSRPSRPEDLHGRRLDLAATVRKGHYLQRPTCEIQVLDVQEHGG